MKLGTNGSRDTGEKGGVFFK